MRRTASGWASSTPSRSAFGDLDHLGGLHRGEPACLVEHRDLAEGAAGAQLVKHDALAEGGAHHLQQAFADHEQRLTEISLLEHDLAGVQAPERRPTRQFGDCLAGERAKHLDRR